LKISLTLQKMFLSYVVIQNEWDIDAMKHMIPYF